MNEIQVGQHWQDKKLKNNGRAIEILDLYGDRLKARVVETGKLTDMRLDNLARRYRKLAEPARK